jgi:hypothetical protein
MNHKRLGSSEAISKKSEEMTRTTTAMEIDALPSLYTLPQLVVRLLDLVPC